MPMSPFYTRCLEAAKTETRSIDILNPGGGLPQVSLLFDENYCDEPGCDCRRVLLMARVFDDYDRILATINFGWEPPEYYQKWMKSTDPEMTQGMSGATLEPFCVQSQYADAILDLAEEHLFSDPGYVARLQKHYVQFKAALPRKRKALDWRQRVRPGGGKRKKR
jgi:hypothetical protein